MICYTIQMINMGIFEFQCSSWENELEIGAIILAIARLTEYNQGYRSNTVSY